MPERVYPPPIPGDSYTIGADLAPAHKPSLKNALLSLGALALIGLIFGACVAWVHP
jgi:hypothetical protein